MDFSKPKKTLDSLIRRRGILRMIKEIEGPLQTLRLLRITMAGIRCPASLFKT